MTETDFYDIFQGQIAAFLLVLARTSGIFLISPFFGGMNVSVRIRATIAIVMAWVIFPVIVEKTTVTAPESILMFSGTVVQELFIGWLIGFIAFVALAAINMAGKIMDMQVGFSVAQVMDPASGQQAPLIGSFLYNLAIIYFLVVNGHHIIIGALLESFNRIPLDGVIWNEAIASFIGDLTAGDKCRNGNFGAYNAANEYFCCRYSNAFDYWYFYVDDADAVFRFIFGRDV